MKNHLLLLSGLVVLLNLFQIPAYAEPEMIIRVRTVENATKKPNIQSQQRAPSGKSIKNFVVEKNNQKYDVISFIPFTDYLAGVVFKEMPTSWPLEALKAQAVIARSYALARMTERKYKSFHVDADQTDQVFSFTNSEKAYQAVKLTEDIYLLNEKGQILKAFYHADCGGHTIPADQVWPGAVNTGTAKDPWCAARSKNAWSATVSIKDWQELQSKSDDGKDEVKIDGKIEKYKSKMTQIFGLSIQKIRENLGFSIVRNSPTDVVVGKNEITLSGKGYGHGAGLCQWGSLAQAQRGRGYLDILMHYYPRAVLTKDKIMLANIKNRLLNDVVTRL